MKSRSLWQSVLILTAIAFASGVGAAAERPNIILMLADDMGLGDTSAYQDLTGNSDADQLHTPHMERLARMGVRFTDAHTPSSRCTPTRYALLTGRYAWRSRLKHWVLFGAQGDPMIEADRPTLATMLREQGYRTAMVGKWHVGLRYRRADGSPAAGWDDADLTQPLFDTPLDHGFDHCWITSRSHGTSGAEAGKKENRANQSIGPGHLHGRSAVSATGQGKKLKDDGPHAYILSKLGSGHSNHAVDFLENHISSEKLRRQPFFLYYACNSNHAPYTPDKTIGGQQVAGAARSVAGAAMNARADFICENDVALGRLLDFLEKTGDPRRPGKKLIENTLVIFTSDNGAEVRRKTATGPFRSNKGSVYEGGHRVPLIVAWPAGQIGDGDSSDSGRTSDQLIGLQDIYATFAEILAVDLPNWRDGDKGAEDSMSVLPAWRGEAIPCRPMLFNDHKEAKDHSAAAIRLDNPTIAGRAYPGKWKMFFDARLLRRGEASPVELYDLASDPQEQNNRINDEALQPLVSLLADEALRHRTVGGHNLASLVSERRVVFNWRSDGDDKLRQGVSQVVLTKRFDGAPAAELAVAAPFADTAKLTMAITGVGANQASADQTFTVNSEGLGLAGGPTGQVDAGEALLIRFDRDVIVESAALVAGDGACGGFCRVAENSPLAIYCVDADIDANDQSGILSDLGVLKAGQTLRLDTRPHFDVESPGSWRLAAITVRVLKEDGITPTKP